MFLDKLLSFVRRKERVIQEDTDSNDQPVEAAERVSAETPTKPPGPYRGDAPLENEDLDLFDRAPFAHRIADTITGRTDPSSLVVAIYGPWGDGKTSVLNFIRNRLRAQGSIITVNFNPWRMEGEQALLQGFFEALAAALDKDLATKSEKVGEILKNYGALLKIAPGGWGDAALGAGAALSSASIDELKDRIGTLLREANRRVVILMDDIDRLDKTEIQAIFRLVKLTGDFENTAYILAFDEKMVASAIGEKYASSSGNPYEAGTNFLEKIVQVPLYLPPAAPDTLRQYCFDLVDEALNLSGTKLDQDQVNEFVRHFIDGIEIRLKTPRMAKRYANALHFSLTILKGETYPPDLMLIEGMRIFFPDLYEFIRRNPESVLRTESRNKGNTGLDAFIAAHTKGMNEREQKAAANLVEALFPRTRSSIYGGDWDAEFARERRIASEYYFPRYFTYGVDRSDVPDVLLNAFVASLSQESAIEPSAALTKMVTERNAEKLIFKLRTFEETIQPAAAERLAIAVACNAARFPDPERLTSFHTPLKQAAVLISRLLQRIAPGSRGAVSLGVIREAASLRFACECARRLRTFPDSKREPILAPAEETAMLSLLGKRIEEHCNILPEPIYLLDPESAGTYLLNWELCCGADAPRDYLSAHIQKEPETATDLMKCFLPTGWGMTTGLPIETDFDRSTYDVLIRVVPPETVADALRSVYGDLLKNPQSDPPESEPRELRLAKQFMFIHEYVIAERQAAKDRAAAGSASEGGLNTSD